MTESSRETGPLLRLLGQKWHFRLYLTLVVIATALWHGHVMAWVCALVLVREIVIWIVGQRNPKVFGDVTVVFSLLRWVVFYIWVAGVFADDLFETSIQVLIVFLAGILFERGVRSGCEIDST